ncbi:GtrA family protein [Candidatus Izemoplasma sp. B36]|uniref:GtrA family protein n=1 Tax=Candidatus Izemoplasma sp. B36 TaxID=3242468 RepID=UPI003556BFA0
MKKQEIILTKRDNIIHMVKFTFFSISAGLIQIGTFTLLFEVFKSRESIAYLIALVLSVLWNFTLNRKFTFKSAANIPVAMTKVAIYYAIFTPLSTWWVEELTQIGWNEYLVVGLTMLTNFVTEFLYTRFVVYRNQINTAVKKEEVIEE